jgi:hypothetical protein
VSLDLNGDTRSQYTEYVLYVKLSHENVKGISIRSADARPVRIADATRRLARKSSTSPIW